MTVKVLVRIEPLDRLKLSNAALRYDFAVSAAENWKLTADAAIAKAKLLQAQAESAEAHAAEIEQKLPALMESAKRERAEVEAKYGLDENDIVDVETGEITRKRSEPK